MHDPMAMRPFMGYNFGKYLQHWLDMEQPDRKVILTSDLVEEGQISFITLSPNLTDGLFCLFYETQYIKYW